MTSDWITVPCLLALRGEFDTLGPHRDKGADGTIGDSAHTSTSDHTPDEDSTALRGKDADNINEVHALDIDSSGPWPAGVTFHQLVMHVVGRCRSGAEKRLRYIIHDRVIYHVDDRFAGRPYTGADPHTNHAHFSASYETARESDRSPWGLLEEFDDMPSAEEIAKAVWDYRLDVNVAAGQQPNMQPAGGILRYGSSEHHVIRDLAAAAADQASAAVRALAARGDDVDEQAIVAGVLAGIDREALAASIAQRLAALPQVSGQVSQAEITAAVKTALHDAFSAA